jgi:pimeloyl-ACP methyl ester carboxylesterase
METYAGDLVALMAHFEISRAVIAGLSMGGYVALAVARRAPERVAGLVLANTRAGADSAEAATGRDRMIALAERDGAAGVARDMLPKLLGASSRRDQPDLEQVVRELIEANTAEAIVEALRAMKARPDSTTWLAEWAGPALIVAGEEDALIPASEVDAMRRGLRHASSVSIRRAGHLSNLEAPGAFNEAIAGWLAGVPR